MGSNKVSKLEWTLHALAQYNKIDLKKEYRFHPKRRWRFDYADIKNKVAVELEGGIWVRGRHNRGKGYRNDTIKYNQAVTLGWRVLRYCTVRDITDYFIKDYQKLINLT